MRWRRRPPPDLAEAQEEIAKAKRRQPEVNRLTRELHEARERNHFAESIWAALRGAQ